MNDLLNVAKSFFFSAFFVQTAASTAQLAVIYQILDAVEKAAKARKDSLRQTLLSFAELNGEKLPKGHYQVVVDGHKILNEHRQATEPAVEPLKDLLKAKGIDILDVFDEVKVLQYNPSKLAHLVEVGKVPQAEVDALRKVTRALKVTLSKALNEALKSVTPVLKEG